MSDSQSPAENPHAAADNVDHQHHHHQQQQQQQQQQPYHHQRHPHPNDSSATCADPSANSLQLLKETVELADITAAGQQQPPPERVPQDSEMKFALTDAAGGRLGGTSIETVYENAGIDKTASSVTASRITASEGGGGNGNGGSGASEVQNAQMSARCGRMNKLRDHTSNIFPAGIMGCRSSDGMDGMPSPRRFLDAGEALHDTVGHIGSTPRKAGVRNDRGRNPVLGTGMDGLESTGDGPEGKATHGSATRVPPGGFSHGLW